MSIRRAEPTGSTGPRTVSLIAGGLAVAAVAVLSGGVAPAQASQTLYCPAAQYCAWENDLRDGHLYNHNATQSFVGDSWNDSFSSLENRRLSRVVYYQHAWGQGHQRELGKNSTALQLQFEWRPDGGTWNDQISSVTVY